MFYNRSVIPDELRASLMEFVYILMKGKGCKIRVYLYNHCVTRRRVTDSVMA